MLLRQPLWLAALFIAVALVSGCVEAPVARPGAPPPRLATVSDAHIPPYASVPYQRFSREAAVQIAYREWRAFGQVVVYPHQELPFDREREQGMWQRVGDYWWQGLPLGWSEAGFTGIHDASGRVFSEREDGNFAWSAAFIDYVMRVSGAGSRFPYSPTHSDYINEARQNGMGTAANIVISAQRPENYPPQRGDLICMWRGRQIHYDDLPTGRFPGHCDIVAAIGTGTIDVIGGNVDNSVSMKHIPVTQDGRLGTAPDTIIDQDYPWFVVLRVAYDE
jgi:hypothetical protein